MRQFTKEIQAKIYNYFDQKIRLKKSTKGWFRGDCIYCDGKYTMGIHFHETKLHCFKCGIHVTPFQAIMEMENLSNIEQVKKLLHLQDEFERFERIHRNEVTEIKPIKLPEEFHSILTGNNQLAKSARNYLEKRGFDIEYLGLRGVGYCDDGPYLGYIIFPFYKRSELVFFQGRYYIPLGPKMRNPPEEEFGIGKTQVMYNEDALMMYKKIRIVESITNALTLGDTGIATLGKSISSWQFNRILRSPVQAVSVMLDPDAYINGLEFAMSICHYKKVKVVKLPDENDVNDLGKNRTILLEKETPYQDYNTLFRLRLNCRNAGPEHTYKRIRFGSSFGEDI
jgi:hypothetical protein